MSPNDDIKVTPTEIRTFANSNVPVLNFQQITAGEAGCLLRCRPFICGSFCVPVLI